MEDDTLWLGGESEQRAVGIQFAHGQWVVGNEEWHGHYESSREALETALQVIGGGARTAMEFREGELASTWLEVYDGESFEVRDQAVFLNPFDREEWTTRRGEHWRVERTHRRLAMIDRPEIQVPEEAATLPLGALRKFEVISSSPINSPGDWCLERYTNELGKPPRGFRWATDVNYRFVFLCPVGWRRNRSFEVKADDSPPLAVFTSVEEELFIRVITYFRDAEAANAESATSPRRRPTIEKQTEKPLRSPKTLNAPFGLSCFRTARRT